VEPGELTYIACKTDSANPPAIIQWLKNSENFTGNAFTNIASNQYPGPYNANFSISILTIAARREDHGSQFVCIVLDEAQNIVLSAGPISLKLKGKYTHNLGEEGRAVMVRCTRTTSFHNGGLHITVVEQWAAD
jgi:hypothetical protein